MRYDKKLLIVDDELDACMLMARLLRHKFAEVECAYSLSEALEKASTMQPNVVLLDNNLPDGYGIEHIHDFKKAGEVPAHVVVISALDLRAEALAAGADAFIGKPLLLGDLPW